MTTRRFPLLSAISIAATALAVATPVTAQKAPLQKIGKGEGQVDIVAWAGYIERGETDPAYDWVTEFEKDTGCKVNVKTAATSDEMVALMNEGGFDLVTASGDASNRLIRGEHGAADQCRSDSQLKNSGRAPAERALALPSMACTTACRTSGAPMC